MPRTTINQAAIERLAISPGVVALLARKAAEVAQTARQLAPHRSGHLAASIVTERLPGGPAVGYAIGSRLRYAIYVERQSPYLRPALGALR